MMKYLLPALAIVGIVVMECVALAHNIDGKVLTASVATVSAIGGYMLRHHTVKKGRE